MVTVAAFSFLINSNKVVLSPFMAIKMQTTVILMSLVETVLIGLPLSAILTFTCGMGIDGLFLGGAIGAGVASLYCLKKII